jgi:hypothetical protein
LADHLASLGADQSATAPYRSANKHGSESGTRKKGKTEDIIAKIERVVFCPPSDLLP